MNIRNKPRAKASFKRKCENDDIVGHNDKPNKSNDLVQMPKEKLQKPTLQVSKHTSKKYKMKEQLNEERFDNISHWPDHDELKSASRCKNINCKQFTHVLCDKCKVHLCFTKNRNCFREYHQMSSDATKNEI